MRMSPLMFADAFDSKLMIDVMQKLSCGEPVSLHEYNFNTCQRYAPYSCMCGCVGVGVCGCGCVWVWVCGCGCGCVCMCVHTCVCSHLEHCVYVHFCSVYVGIVYMCTACVGVCAFMHMFVSMYVCTYVCMCMYGYVCMYVCVYVCMYAQVSRDQSLSTYRSGRVGGDPDAVLPGGPGTATDETVCRPRQ